MRRLALLIAVGSLLALSGLEPGAAPPGPADVNGQIHAPTAANLRPVGSPTLDRLIGPVDLPSQTGLNEVSNKCALEKDPVSQSMKNRNCSVASNPGAKEASSDGFLGDLLQNVQVLRTRKARTTQASAQTPPGAPPREQAGIVLTLDSRKAAEEAADTAPKSIVQKQASALKELSKVAVLPPNYGAQECLSEDEGECTPVGPMSPLGPYDPEGVIATFRDPVEHAVPSSGFGEPRGNGPHLGVDFQGGPGTPVLAVSNGRVVFAGALSPFEAYGEIVVIDHGCGVYTLYGHVDPDKGLRQKGGPRLYAPVEVTAGTRIAEIGRTKSYESSTGTHLHFEIMVIKKEKSKVRYTFLNAAYHLPYARKLDDAGRSEAQRRAPAGRPTIPAPPHRALCAVLNVLDYPVEIYSDQIEDTSLLWKSRLARGPSGFQAADLLSGLAAVKNEAAGADRTAPLFVQASVSLAGQNPFRRRKSTLPEKPRMIPLFPMIYGHEPWIPTRAHFQRSNWDIRPGISEVIPFDVPGGGNPY